MSQKKSRLTDYLQISNNIITYPEEEDFECESLGKTLFYKMQEHKEKVFQIDGITGQQETHGFMLQKCIRAAIAMRKIGVKTDDVIGISTGNHPNAYVPGIAALFLGAKIYFMNPTLSLPEIKHILNITNPKLIFSTQNNMDIISKAIKDIECNISIVELVEDYRKYSEFLVESEEETTFVPVTVDTNKTTVIVFTSGTTGMPKGVCLNHYTVLRRVKTKLSFSNQGSRYQLLYTTPDWIRAVVSTISYLYHGKAVLMLPEFDLHTIWEMVEKYKLYILMLTPYHLNTACSSPHAIGDTSSLRYIWTTGGALSKALINSVKMLLPGVIFFQVYGSTEMFGLTLSFQFINFAEDLRLLQDKPSSSGRPLPGYSYKIVDPDTEEVLGPNQTGELRIKTKYQLNHYHKYDSTNVWDKDGFFKTGDLAYYDEDYCFFIVDRLKLLIKYRNYHIMPAKLENLLLSHPEVKNALVVGIPNDADMEHATAVVELKEFATANAKKIEHYVNDRVEDKYKLRGGVKIIERIPTNTSGKICSKHIKDMILQGKL